MLTVLCLVAVFAAMLGLAMLVGRRLELNLPDVEIPTIDPAKPSPADRLFGVDVPPAAGAGRRVVDARTRSALTPDEAGQ